MKIVCVKAIQSFDVGLAVVVRSSTAICCHRVSVCRHAFMAKCTTHPYPTNSFCQRFSHKEHTLPVSYVAYELAWGRTAYITICYVIMYTLTPWKRAPLTRMQLRCIV